MKSKRVSRVRVKMKPAASKIAGQAAERRNKERSGIHDCEVVRIEPPNIVTRWSDKRDHFHLVGPDAVIIVDGQACELKNVSVGLAVRLTTKRGNPQEVSRIESSAEISRSCQ